MQSIQLSKKEVSNYFWMPILMLCQDIHLPYCTCCSCWCHLSWPTIWRWKTTGAVLKLKAPGSPILPFTNGCRSEFSYRKGNPHVSNRSQLDWDPTMWHPGYQLNRTSGENCGGYILPVTLIMSSVMMNSLAKDAASLMRTALLQRPHFCFLPCWDSL